MQTKILVHDSMEQLANGPTSVVTSCRLASVVLSAPGTAQPGTWAV